MTTIFIDGLEKSFRDGASSRAVTVLSGVSLALEGPAIVALVGPNGVGKTTLLRLLAGILSADRGTVLVNGKPPYETRIGYVPQGNPVFPWRRIDDDIAVPLEIRGMHREERREHVRNLVQRFSFRLPLDRRTFGLSGGQRQLVNLCRALVGPEPPKLLLLDEPFAALDVTSREEFLEYLGRIYAEFQPLILLTTHQLDLAILASDAIVPLNKHSGNCLNDSLLRIHIPRPRTMEDRLSPSFQNLLTTVEASFRATSLPGT